mmetsp:Transcript_53832/g.112412  ORF Transcript_53832/g.112412 Transcript_53832/m.112412 type:complete len:238 (-) Transcript_53832:86-799(-)
MPSSAAGPQLGGSLRVSGTATHSSSSAGRIPPLTSVPPAKCVELSARRRSEAPEDGPRGAAPRRVQLGPGLRAVHPQVCQVGAVSAATVDVERPVRRRLAAHRPPPGRDGTSGQDSPPRAVARGEGVQVVQEHGAAAVAVAAAEHEDGAVWRGRESHPPAAGRPRPGGRERCPGVGFGVEATDVVEVRGCGYAIPASEDVEFSVGCRCETIAAPRQRRKTGSDSARGWQIQKRSQAN